MIFDWGEDSDPFTLVLIDGAEKFVMVIHLCNSTSYYDIIWNSFFSKDYEDCYTNYYYLQLGHFEMPWRRKNHHSIWHFEIGWTHFSNLQVYHCWCMSTCGCQAKDNTSAHTFHNRCTFWSYDNVPVSIVCTDHLPGFWPLYLHKLCLKEKRWIGGCRWP